GPWRTTRPPNGQARPRLSGAMPVRANFAVGVVMPLVRSIWLIGMPPSTPMIGVTVPGWTTGPGLIWTWASRRLPQKFKASGSTVDGGTAQDRTARTRPILGWSHGWRW